MAVRFSADSQDYTRALSLGAVTQWSISCWVKISVDRNAYSTIWCLDGESGASYYLLQTDTDGVSLQVYTDAVSGINPTGGVLTAGTWYHIGVSVNGANGTAVIRAAGAAASTVTTWSTGDASTNIGTLRLGESSFNGEWLNGAMAAFKMWTGATLTRDELDQEGLFTAPRRTAGLRVWYPFSQAGTADASGLGNTLSGGTGAATEDGPPIAWRPARRRTWTRLSLNADLTPPTLTGTTSMPTPAVSTGVTVGPSLLTGTTSMPTPDVFVGSSPPTNVQPGLLAGTTSMPTPTVTTVKNVTITPVPLIGRAIMPMPDVGVPINPGDDLDSPGQLTYNGFRMGSGTPYSWKLLTGWWVDMPTLDNGDTADPTAHGAMPGAKYAQSRIVTYESLITVPRAEIEQVAADFLAGLPVPDADEQLPIAVRIRDQILIGYGACTARAAPIDVYESLGILKATAQFTLARPELYSRELLSATIDDGGFVEVTNLGNTRTKPLLRCPGPANGPQLIVERILPDGSTDLRVIEFDLEVLAGEMLIIDPANGTVTIGDVSKLRTRTGASVGVPDFVLGPGVSELSYSTADGDAPAATALWRHAYL
ncbi:LamG-like jellyroll fold domain-containing protein [Streptosporangium sp. DT93]|uniref:LamG-like jellyroll fold domain-containing protein n=1 Tax=Streptosporangium sp. DT93 TaxID=3393428 RepID=UPI003CF173AC